MTWQPVSPDRYRLAEGPFWDARQQALYWVDIAGHLACRLDTSGLRQWQLETPVSAFIPCESGDALVTTPEGVLRLDLASPSKTPILTAFCRVDPVAGNRPNEARCDDQGRLWVGTMQNNLADDGSDLPVTRRSGGLFRVDARARVTPLLEGQGIVNTLLWPDDGALLCADSLDGILYRYPIDQDQTLGPRQPWAAVGPGVPDGSAMDADGYVWNARWGGGCLLRFAPDGCLDRQIDLPVSHPTSCVFGGPDLRTLYVTSAAGSGPLDGAVLHASVEVQGRGCTRFAG